MPKSSILEKKLKVSDSQVQKYVRQIEKILTKQETIIARLEVENIRLNVRVKFLEAELKKNKPVSIEKNEELRKLAEKAAEELSDKDLHKNLVEKLRKDAAGD